MILPRVVLLSTLLLGIIAFVATTQRNALLGMLDIVTTTSATVSPLNATSTAATAATGSGAVSASQDASPREETNDNLLVYIGYLSAPDNREKRASLRKDCFPTIRDACLGSIAANATSSEGWGPHCNLKFFIGQPNDPRQAGTRARGHTQGALATQIEIETAEKLQNESDAFGDMQMIPMRDTYIDLPSKTLSIVREGALSGARVVLKIDDDQCPDMKTILEIARTTPPNVARYVGTYQWKGTEYTIMQGADGSINPYMSGPAYLLSNALARAVAIDDINHSVLFMKYGSSSEDVDMGKWFEYAKTTHPEFEFKMETISGLARDHQPPKKDVGRTSTAIPFTPTAKKALGPVQNVKDDDQTETDVLSGGDDGTVLGEHNATLAGGRYTAVPHIDELLEKNLPLSLRRQSSFFGRKERVVHWISNHEDRKKRDLLEHGQVSKNCCFAIVLNEKYAFRHIYKTGGTAIESQVGHSQVREDEYGNRLLVAAVRDPIDHFLSGWAECGARDKLLKADINGTYDERVFAWLNVARSYTWDATCVGHSLPQANFLLLRTKRRRKQGKSHFHPRVDLVGDMRELPQLLELAGFRYNETIETPNNATTTQEKSRWQRDKSLLSNRTIDALCKFLALDYYVGTNRTIVAAECDTSKPGQNFTLNDEGRIKVGSLPGYCFGNASQQTFRYDPATGQVKGGSQCVDYNVEEGRIARWQCHGEANQMFQTYRKPE
ncbi:hypothetical protein ACHAXT_011207 [Thalassiosira profunda]